MTQTHPSAAPMADPEATRELPGEPREIVLTRTLAAPRALVFTTWTDPVHVGRWWGPDGFTTTIHEMDVRPGGLWRYTMHGPDGTDYPNRILYAEVVAPERLVYDHDGDPQDGQEDPHAFHVTVTFEEQGGRTVVTMRSRLASAEQRALVAEFAVPGGKQTLARLDAYLAALQAAV
jgi:uncharacterized protein YndB with AHSA1/START domain